MFIVVYFSSYDYYKFFGILQYKSYELVYIIIIYIYCQYVCVLSELVYYERVINATEAYLCNEPVPDYEPEN